MSGWYQTFRHLTEIRETKHNKGKKQKEKAESLAQAQLPSFKQMNCQ